MKLNIFCFTLAKLGSFASWKNLLTIADVPGSYRTRCTRLASLPPPFSAIERHVPQTMEDFHKQARLKPPTVDNLRLLKVAILGEPNAGKSTLTNALMRWQVCSISKKVHTTRHNTAAVLVEGTTQIVFIDTPGLVSFSHGKRHNLEASLVMDPEHSLRQADTILVIVDAGNKWTRNRFDARLAKLLQANRGKDMILVLNKVDLVKKKEWLLEVTRKLTGGSVEGCPPVDTDNREVEDKIDLEALFNSTEKKLMNMKQMDAGTVKGVASPIQFSGVFMVSAIDGDGVDGIRDYLMSRAKAQPWLYHHSVVTDQHPHEVAIMAVRGRLLDYFHKEIPYRLEVAIEMWEVEPSGLLRIGISVTCGYPRLVALVLGPGGKNVSRIVEEARQAIANTFRCDVVLKLAVKEA